MTVDTSEDTGHEVPGAAKAPRQRRSLATLIRLLDATEELLNERDYEGITVADIVARARSSVGSFYARFETKDAVLLALLERFQTQSEKAIVELSESEEWAKLNLEGRFRLYIRLGIAECRRRHGLLKLRLRRRITPGQAVLPDQPERDLKMVAGIRHLFATVYPEIRHLDKDHALSFALRTVNGVVLSTILLEDASRSFGEITDEELTEQLVSVVTSYLRGR